MILPLRGATSDVDVGHVML